MQAYIYDDTNYHCPNIYEHAPLRVAVVSLIEVISASAEVYVNDAVPTLSSPFDAVTKNMNMYIVYIYICTVVHNSYHVIYTELSLTNSKSGLLAFPPREIEKTRDLSATLLSVVWHQKNSGTHLVLFSLPGIRYSKHHSHGRNCMTLQTSETRRRHVISQRLCRHLQNTYPEAPAAKINTVGLLSWAKK